MPILYQNEKNEKVTIIPKPETMEYGILYTCSIGVNPE